MTRKESPLKQITNTRRSVLKSLGGIGAISTIGSVSASAQTSDRVKWRSKLLESDSDSVSASVRTSPTIVDGTVYFGADSLNKSGVYAVDASSGKEIWKFEDMNLGTESSPSVVDNTVFIGSDGNQLYALNATTGEEQWRKSFDGSISASPTVKNGVVFVGTDDVEVLDNRMYALDTVNGQEKWEFRTGPEIESSATVTNGTVYFASHSDLYAVDVNTGEKKWSSVTQDSIVSSPTVASNSVFVGNTDNYFYSFNVETGEEQWVFEAEGSVNASPTALNGTVFVGDNGMNFYAIDAETGEQEWKFNSGRPFSSSPTVVDETIFVGCQDNKIYAFDSNNGNKKWDYATGGYVLSSPTVVDGTVFVGSNDGYIYSLNSDVQASSEGSRVSLGTLGHHNKWAKQASEYRNTDEVDIISPELKPSEVVGVQSHHTLEFEARNVSADGFGDGYNDTFNITFPDSVTLENFSNVNIDSAYSNVEQAGNTLNFAVSPDGGGTTQISVKIDIILSATN